MTPRPADPDWNHADSSGRRLSGWKDIAAYFDRSVRTVQRWEAEYGLPVRRLGLGRAEVVTALVADLERWRQSADAEAAGQAIGVPGQTAGMPAAAETGVDSVDRAGSVPSSRVRLVRGAFLGILLVVAAIAVAIGSRKMPVAATAEEPDHVEASGHSIAVRSATGALLWEHRFSGARTPVPPRHVVVDLDADGHHEVLAVAGVPSAVLDEATLHCFDYRGNLRWTHRHSARKKIGTQAHDGHYGVDAFFVTDGPGGRMLVWVASTDLRGFPTVLEKLDSAGAVRGEYWSGGRVTVLERANWDGRRVVLVGATSDEFETASLAVLDEDRPTGSAPVEAARHRCADCPAGEPLAFVVFPRPAGCAQISESAAVGRIHPDVGGTVVVRINYGHDDGTSAIALFTLDRQLRAIRVDTGDRFEAACLELARRGKVAHYTPGAASEELRTLRWWDGTAFRAVKAPAGPARSDR